MVVRVFMVVFLVALAGQSCFPAFSHSLCATSTLCCGQQQSTELPVVCYLQWDIVSVWQVSTCGFYVFSVKSWRLCARCAWQDNIENWQDRIGWHKKVHRGGELPAAASVRTTIFNKHMKRNVNQFNRENVRMESNCFCTLLCTM